MQLRQLTRDFKISKLRARLVDTPKGKELRIVRDPATSNPHALPPRIYLDRENPPQYTVLPDRPENHNNTYVLLDHGEITFKPRDNYELAFLRSSNPETETRDILLAVKVNYPIGFKGYKVFTLSNPEHKPDYNCVHQNYSQVSNYGGREHLEIDALIELRAGFTLSFLFVPDDSTHLCSFRLINNDGHIWLGQEQIIVENVMPMPTNAACVVA
jgi:hypothetical protein